jgi:hypothetical protein
MPGGIDWAWAIEDPGQLALIPRLWVAPEWIARWPVLPDGKPGWICNIEAISGAFAKILRDDDDQIRRFFHRGRHDLHLGEQMRDARLIRSPDLASRVLQVAVFGEVIFT